MSNFNDFFKNKGLKTIMERFFDEVDSYNTRLKITNLKYEIVKEPEHPASYYIENNLTASHKVKITYDLNNDGVIRETEFEVPKEIDGAFIIDGAYRISANKLGNDYDCRINTTGPGDHYINFDYNRKYDIDKKVLKVKKFDSDSGNPRRTIEIPYCQIDEYGDKELLKLTPKQTKKFLIKLDIEDYTPEYITRQLIDDSISFGDDRVKDLIIDKSVNSVSQDFMQYIFRDNNGRNFWSAKKRIRTYFAKYNKLHDQLNPISTLAYKFFKGSAKDSASSKEIRVPPGINSINLESIKSKISVPETVAINTSMTDLIDLADTPINTNTNLQNSLTVSTHITDDGVLFDVYDKDFKRITIDYLDYLNSRVVASECVDYDTNKIIPDEEGKIWIKHRMKRKKVDKDSYDLIDLHPDYRLSSSSRRIPFLNSTDSVRISMGSSMLRQAIPLANAQRPLVDTGHSEELEDNVLNTKFAYPEGEVTNITESNIEIKLPSGETTNIPRRTAIQSLNDVAVWTEPKVKVGDKVKKGDIITGPHEIKKDTVQMGLNTFVLYSAYKGLVHEDAVVISESYADRMKSYGLIDLTINVTTPTTLKWIAPVGTKVKSRDSVVTLYKAIKVDEVNKLLQDKLGGVYTDDSGKDITEFTVEQNLTVPNNVDEAVVSDVMIQENVKPRVSGTKKKPDYTFARGSKKVIDKYMNDMDRQIIYDQFPEYVASDRLRKIDMDPSEYTVVYTIRVRLIKTHKPGIADKITNRYGGKGVVSAVLPDSQMPVVNGRTVELIMNPYSTINIVVNKSHRMLERL